MQKFSLWSVESGFLYLNYTIFYANDSSCSEFDKKHYPLYFSLTFGF